MKKLLVFAIAILGFSAVSFGQNGNTASTTATASGTIVTPIKIDKTSDMVFGTIIASAGSVTLVPGAAAPTYNGVYAYTGVNGLTTPATAKFTVSGNLGNAFAINVTSLPATVVGPTGSVPMALSAWSSTSTGTSTSLLAYTSTGASGHANLGSLGATTPGAYSFEMGATLTVAATQMAGLYTSAPFSVTVAYE